MDFDCAVRIISKMLKEKRPETFNSSWTRYHAPKEEITKHVRFTIDEWIESLPKLLSWEGYEFMIPQRIETKGKAVLTLVSTFGFTENLQLYDRLK